MGQWLVGKIVIPIKKIIISLCFNSTSLHFSSLQTAILNPAWYSNNWQLLQLNTNSAIRTQPFSSIMWHLEGKVCDLKSDNYLTIKNWMTSVKKDAFWI